tara:strand:+ start:429 stop:899 length:471 start_codon:yes stop_codon:yes gene_type:complete
MSGIVNDIAVVSSRHHPEFKAGTKMVFNQTAAPTGWTKVTSANDVALRLVSGSVGTGGSVAFETAFASHTPTISMSNAAVTLATATVPAHVHTYGAYEIGGGGAEWTFHGPNASAAWSGTTSSHGGGGAHTHTNSASSSAVNLDVSYVDVIIATKD